MNFVLANIVNLAIDIFSWLIIIEVLASWILVAGARLPNWVYNLLQAVHSITAPVLNPIRRLMPNLGGLDLSPIIALLLLRVIGNVIVSALYGRI